MGSVNRGTEAWAKSMPKSKAPCKNCPERKVGCHGRCEKYQEYNAKQERIRLARKKIIDGDYFPGSNKKL